MPQSYFTIPEYPELQFGSLYCIGRNYAKHAEEMGNEAPSEPVIFLKPRSSLVRTNSSVLLPVHSGSIHYEAELVVLIGRKVKSISPEESLTAVKAVAVGIDLTARDLQAEAKKNGLPWSLAKGFDTFAPLGTFSEYTPEINLRELEIELRVNGDVRQSGNTSNMIFPVNKIISYLSNRFTLYPGDMIFTGTPEGVGPVQPGDSLTATLHQDLSMLHIHAET